VRFPLPTRFQSFRAATPIRAKRLQAGLEPVSSSAFNNKGDRIINYATDDTSSEGFILLEGLYNQAREAYYKVGEAYKSFIKSIDSEMIIGENDNDPDPF
jgi:hypothetical protein